MAKLKADVFNTAKEGFGLSIWTKFLAQRSKNICSMTLFATRWLVVRDLSDQGHRGIGWWKEAFQAKGPRARQCLAAQCVAVAWCLGSQSRPFAQDVIRPPAQFSPAPAATYPRAPSRPAQWMDTGSTICSWCSTRPTTRSLVLLATCLVSRFCLSPDLMCMTSSTTRTWP